MSNIIKKPNLPQNRVSLAIIGENYTDTADELKKIGIDTLFVTRSTFVRRGLECHADLQFCQLNDKKALISLEQNKLKEQLQATGFEEIKFIEKNLDENYPDDVLLNFVIMNDTVIYNPDTISLVAKDYIEKSSFNRIKTRQGYTKCSIAVVSDDAIITEDISIGSQAEKNNIDCLVIKKGFVKLRGFDYGFIGGAAGKINKDMLAFNGKIENHPDFNSIKSFMLNHGVYPYSLNNRELEDIGSIIPVKEQG